MPLTSSTDPMKGMVVSAGCDPLHFWTFHTISEFMYVTET